MREIPQEQAVPRRALLDDEALEVLRKLVKSGPPALYSAWQRLRLDTPVELLPYANIIAVRGDEYVVASIYPVAHGLLALDLAPVSTWRNGGEWPRHREWDVPEFTTVESLALAHGLAPTSAFHLPDLSWRRLLPPCVTEHDTTISLAEAFARLPRDAGPRGAAFEHVAEIREVYGQMLTDIAYRIENSALFDSTVPTTRQFETALALWSDVSSNTNDEEVQRRSAVVVVAFRTARSHAEVVGIQHLPTTAHDSARRAAGAARMARSSSSEAERDAAHSRVVAILGSLALDCLPDPAALPRAITDVPGVADTSARKFPTIHPGNS